MEITNLENLESMGYESLIPIHINDSLNDPETFDAVMVEQFTLINNFIENSLADGVPLTDLRFRWTNIRSGTNPDRTIGYISGRATRKKQ